MLANISSHRLLITTLLAASIFVACAYLFLKNDRELDPDYQKNWWTLSFATPNAPDDLRFTITNHTPNTAFTYRVTSGTVALETQDITIPQGTQKIITPGPTQIEAPGDAAHASAKREIRVWPTGSPQKSFSIYRQE